jgi:hypothetical protein
MIDLILATVLGFVSGAAGFMVWQLWHRGRKR